MKKNGIFFVLTSISNISPSMAMEFLLRVTKVFKDYCGIFTEESIRSNFILLYELLDEIMDYGVIQGTSSDTLKSYIFNEPVVVEKKKTKFQLPKFNPKTTSSDATNKPISFKDSKQGGKDEIFVDIFERISITFNSNGNVLHNAIDGTIQMKSYLSGNPELKLALNEDLTIGKQSGSGNYGVVGIDDCNFHECVRLDDFDSQRIISFHPPDGEFVVMNYRITSDFRIPFRIFPFFELSSPYKVELIVKIRADIPENNSGTNIVVAFPVPKSTSSASSTMGIGVTGQSTEYDSKKQQVLWKIKKMAGGTEHTLRTKVVLTKPHTSSVRKEIGPVSVNFEVPLYNPSSLQVRYLRIMPTVSGQGTNPYRWVRYVTKSQSYVCRL
uniref:MHD domain-containing protein n=1 Tax=Lotharella oceanica TaxID=641309 RepID=A0A7S2TGB3_9EUKA